MNLSEESEVIEIAGLLTQVTTLVATLTGMPMIIQMLRTKNTDHIPYVFFLMAFTVGLFSVGYGLYLSDSNIVKANAFGMILSGFYTVAYIYAVKEKSNAILMLFMTVGFLIGTYFYLTLFVHPSNHADKLGMVGCLITLAMHSSLLVQTVEFVNAKSCYGISSMLLFANTACSASWYWYGKLINDIYVYGPNIPGISISVVQVILLMLYGRQPPKTKVH